MMIIPMFLAALINTFCPQIVQIGSFTTAVFSNAGAATAIGIQFLCIGTQLQLKEMPKVLKRGGTLLISKFVIGVIIGLMIHRIFGAAGFLGLTTLAVISAVTNSNGCIYLSLMTEYGDETDCAAMSILNINDGPFLTMIALGASGLADIPLLALCAAVMPIVIGMILGNIDQEMKAFLEPGINLMVPFVGFTLGGSINFSSILTGGASGILLGLITVFIGGPFIVFFDKLICKRPGYAGWAAATTAGNAIAVPAAVALVDPAWIPYVEQATTQVAAAAVLTAILVPFITSWWAKKYGCPKYPRIKPDGTEVS